MPFLVTRQLSTTAVCTIVLLLFLSIVFWASMSKSNDPERINEDIRSTITTIGSVPYQIIEDDKQWINDGIKMRYKPTIQPTTDRYEVTPDAVTIIRNTVDSIHSETFANERRLSEYVTPIKISENQFEDPPDELSMAKRHHSGHFRVSSAEVWDPHPQYEFTAFGRKFRLRLSHDSRFIAPAIKVTHVKVNETIRDRPNDQLGCFYSGYVDGDPTSDVSVSLCDGMTGLIRTSNGSYIIKPTKHWSEEGNLQHIFSRELKTRSNFSVDNGPAELFADPHDCGVIDYDAEEEVPIAMLDDSSASDIYVGDRDRDRHRDRRSSTAKSFWDHSVEQESIKNRLEHFTQPNEPQLYFINATGDQRYKAWRGHERMNKSGDAIDPLSGWRYRRALAREYFVEIMVVADAKMIEFHGKDLISYIMVLMSTVYRIYKDPSIGNPMSIAVMKIVTVDQVFGTKHPADNGVSAADMLKQFCKWQKFHNPHEPSPDHHDTALLLTRENLCQEPGQSRCETLGLAELGRMCYPGSSCAIVQDTGLATAFTIAHEIGHVLNMPHDDDVKCSKFQIRTDVHNFMTRRLDNNTFRWEWSKCSRHYLSDFLENANCLLDEPSNVIERADSRRLPGEAYSSDRQCELAFGPGSKICASKIADVCERLWCTSGSPERQQCRTQNMPWADGTPCGDERSPYKWCHRGECSSVRNLAPVNGQWGEWGPYGECSRSCGGGIQKKYRECNGPPPSNGGDYCIGERVQYRSCGTEECPVNTPDFREEQCSSFDNKNLKIPGLPRNIHWHAKYNRLIPLDRCKLFCQVESNQYYMLRDRVVDGTPCGPDTFHICVRGHCKPAGCDHVLGSTAELDTCGVCGGDNSSCHRITGSHNTSVYGYTKVLQIPAGSSNIDIRQHGWNESHNDSNYLALRLGETGKYVLNGKFMVMHRKVIIRPGLTIEYSGPETRVERLNSSRPTNVDIVLEVLSVGNVLPPQITYEYTVPKYILKNYTWILSNWSDCSYACDGVKYRKALCQNIESNDYVSGDYCRREEKPQEEKQPCNNYCSLQWKVTVVSECSSHCGLGNRTISSQCVQYVKSRGRESAEAVSNYACMHMSRPPSLEPCRGSCNPADWSYGPWESCSVTCGGGVQARNAACIDSHKKIIPEVNCPAKEKIVERVCGQEVCPRWSFGEWSPCSASCGTGKRGRPMWCHIENQIVSENHCTGPRPNSTEICDAGPCFRWDTSEWSACNTDCGHGRQYRKVRCMKGLGVEVPDEYCSYMKKAKQSKKCHRSICPESVMVDGDPIQSRYTNKRRWRVSNWTRCSKECGDGIQQRAVTCHSINQYGWVDPVPTEGCPITNRPMSFKRCKLRECDDRYHWSSGNWRKCSHFCGKKGKQTRRLFCHDSTGKRVPRYHCPREFAPKRERRCNQRRCGPRTCAEAQKRYKSIRDGEYALLIGGRSMRIYCHNAPSNYPREYLTLPAGDRDNYAEIYGRRLLNPQQCPYNGQRNESCDCVSDDGNVAGLTYFKRVRIDPINLMIIGDDFTFSRTYGAKRVEFGKAGDCYSRENCPQGRFSIDLTGTLLKLTPEVSWSSKKSMAFMAINKINEQKVRGKCGGYCGFCMPKNGLKLDVLPP